MSELQPHKDMSEKEQVESYLQNYILKGHNINGSEWDRLDDLHRGFSSYMNGQLTFAPISSPTLILDIGAGSGAWFVSANFKGNKIKINYVSRAIQAAQTFTHAKVVAADISKLPERPLPPNISYCYCDVLKPLPFDKEHFDVVHLRSVLFHLPKLQISSVIERVSHTLKPNGWLIIEDYGRHTGHSNSRGPAQSAVNLMFIDMVTKRGLEPFIGENLGEILQNLNLFSEINTKKIELTLCASNAPLSGVLPGERDLSNALRVTLERVAMQMDTNSDYKAAGITPELKRAWLEERNDPAFLTFHDIWFTWSRKRQTL